MNFWAGWNVLNYSPASIIRREYQSADQWIQSRNTFTYMGSADLDFYQGQGSSGRSADGCTYRMTVMGSSGLNFHGRTSAPATTQHQQWQQPWPQGGTQDTYRITIMGSSDIYFHNACELDTVPQHSRSHRPWHSAEIGNTYRITNMGSTHFHFYNAQIPISIPQGFPYSQTLTLFAGGDTYIITNMSSATSNFYGNSHSMASSHYSPQENGANWDRGGQQSRAMTAGLNAVYPRPTRPQVPAIHSAPAVALDSSKNTVPRPKQEHIPDPPHLVEPKVKLEPVEKVSGDQVTELPLATCSEELIELELCIALESTLGSKHAEIVARLRKEYSTFSSDMKSDVSQAIQGYKSLLSKQNPRIKLEETEPDTISSTERPRIKRENSATDADAPIGSKRRVKSENIVTDKTPPEFPNDTESKKPGKKRKLKKES